MINGVGLKAGERIERWRATLPGAPGRRAAINRLKEAQRIGIARKVRVVVQNQNLDSAYDEMRRQRVGGEVVSTDGTTKIYVPKRRKSTKY